MKKNMMSADGRKWLFMYHPYDRALRRCGDTVSCPLLLFLLVLLLLL